MPLTINASDYKNIDETTDGEFYALATCMMVAGVPTIENDAHIIKLVSRVLLLDVMPRKNEEQGPRTLTVDEFVTWVRKFGKVTTNASTRTDASVAKSARESAERIARHAVEGK